MATLDINTLRRFDLFAGISDKALENLARNGALRTVSAGEAIIRKSRDADQLHLLLAGSVEVRTSFFDRKNFCQDDQEARRPLEAIAPPGIAVTAVSDCTVLRFFRTQVEGADSEPLIQPINDHSATDNGYVVEHAANQDDDWLSRFLMSPMVGHLGAGDIHRMLGCVKEIQAEAGEVIIRAGEPGEKFYIIKSGTAVVKTHAFGAADSEEILLGPGSYFGEEALVGDTIRNAEVEMYSDGILCAMDKAFFNTVIRPAVVVSAPEEQLQHLLEGGSEGQVLLDIRFYPEYCRGHRQHSRNLPISTLRSKLHHLDTSKQYFITPEGGPRSELATFILRQAGFDAVLIRPA